MHFWHRTLQFPNDIKTLIERGKHIDHTWRKHAVLGGFLEVGLLVLVPCVMQILHGNVVVVGEPVHDEGLEPGTVVGRPDIGGDRGSRGVFWIRAHRLHVLVEEEFDAEVKVEILRGLDYTMLYWYLVVFLQRNLQVLFYKKKFFSLGSIS